MGINFRNVAHGFPKISMLFLQSYTAGFFFTVTEKLQARKTPAMKKLKHFFSQKLKVPEDFSDSMAKKPLNFNMVFRTKFYQETKSFLNLKKWHLHLFIAKIWLFLTKFTNSCKNSGNLSKNSSKSLKKTQGLSKKTQHIGGCSLFDPSKKCDKKACFIQLKV